MQHKADIKSRTKLQAQLLPELQEQGPITFNFRVLRKTWSFTKSTKSATITGTVQMALMFFESSKLLPKQLLLHKGVQTQTPTSE